MPLVLSCAPRLFLLLVVALVISLAYGNGRPALAAAFIIDSTGDLGDATPGDGACDIGWGPCTLRAAIQEANALAGADSISLPAGTYTLDIAGAGEDAAATGDLDITGDLTLTGAGAGETVIDGGGLDRVFHIIGSVQITGVTIRNGLGDETNGGGGILNWQSLTLVRSAVTGNETPLAGGGIHNTGTMVIRESTIDSNHSQMDEGGIFNREGATLEIVASTVSNNRADRYTGGITNYATLSLVSTTISGNEAPLGGGVQNLGEGQMTATNSTIAFNEGGGEGGLRNTGGDATITNTIIAGNSGDQCLQASGGSLTSNGHNLAGDDTCDLTGPGDLSNIANPMLGPLADNGGPTQTHALLPGSPAIDAGSPDCPPPATDQRGVARPQGPACDIGAFEAPAGGRIWGDVHCDGAVDSVDSLGDLRYLAHLPPLPHAAGCPEIGGMMEVTGFSPHAWGDVDCDTDVNSIDALRILRYVAHLSLTPIAGCPDVGADVTIS